jgi:glycine cleavage system aminomethyltransferase T
VPEVKFFNMDRLTIAGRTTWALRHGMAGQPGLELFGPWDDGEEVRQALIEAGKDYGMRLVGGRAYSSNTVESGWIPSPLPAVYSGAAMKAYREWLPAEGYEGKTSIGGSFYSDRIDDYYFTPWDLGYGNFVKFDHDFVGREALEKMAGKTHRKKVTLALNDDDVLRVMGSAFKEPRQRAKFMEFPSAVYSMHPYDTVLAKGKAAGVSTWISYTANEGKMLTLAVMDAEFATPGMEVTLVWGEPGGGSAKPLVERHVQTEVRGVVSPVPYSQVARTGYADGWRTKALAS